MPTASPSFNTTTNLPQLSPPLAPLHPALLPCTGLTRRVFSACSPHSITSHTARPTPICAAPTPGKQAPEARGRLQPCSQAVVPRALQVPPSSPGALGVPLPGDLGLHFLFSTLASVSSLVLIPTQLFWAAFKPRPACCLLGDHSRCAPNPPLPHPLSEQVGQPGSLLDSARSALALIECSASLPPP